MADRVPDNIFMGSRRGCDRGHKNLVWRGRAGRSAKQQHGDQREGKISSCEHLDLPWRNIVLASLDAAGITLCRPNDGSRY
jgi:hypothetical protein